MSQADLARMHRAPAADKARGRNAVVRAAKWSVSRQQPVDVLAQNRMDAERLLLVLEG